MAMVFCTGCGKEIHETAPMCPHCGFRLADSSLAPPRSVGIGMAVVSSALAFFNLLSCYYVTKGDKDLQGTTWMTIIASLILSSISLAQKRKGKALNIISLVVSGLAALALIGVQSN